MNKWNRLKNKIMRINNKFNLIRKKIFKNLTSKPITPSETEIKLNTRARSAKLRVAIKI